MATVRDQTSGASDYFQAATNYPSVKIYGVYGYHAELSGKDDALQSKAHNIDWPSYATWNTAKPGFGYKNTTSSTATSYFGPELKLADLLSAQAPYDHYIVKLAVAGTGLAYSPTQDNWDPSSGRLFNQLLAMIANAYNSQRSSVRLRVAGLILVQGETDALHPESASGYKTNLNKFINAFRTQAHAKGCAVNRDIPVVMARIQDKPVWTYRETVRLAQKELSKQSAHIKLVDTDDFDTEGDGVHFSEYGQVQLGERAYSALFLSPHPDESDQKTAQSKGESPL